jgi:hypothetical protein
MSNNSPAFQFYPKEYLASEKVAMMDLAYEGPYLRALCYCWLNGSIPSDPKQLARLIGKNCSEDGARVVQECFILDSENPSRMVHSTLERERAKQGAWSEKSANGGKKSAKIRKEKAELKGGSNLVEPKVNIAFASPSPSPIKIKHKSMAIEYKKEVLAVYEFYKVNIKASTRKADSLRWISIRGALSGYERLVMCVAGYLISINKKQTTDEFKKECANFFGEDCAYEAFMPDDNFYKANIERVKKILGGEDGQA